MLQLTKSSNSKIKLVPFIWGFLRAYPYSLFLFLVCITVTALYGTISTYLTKVIVNDLVNIHSSNLSFLYWPAILFILNGEITGWGWRGTEYIRYRIAPTIKNHIINQTFDYVHQHAYRYFQDNLSGSIANNIYTLADNIEQIWSFQLLFILRGAILLASAMASMYFVHMAFFIGLLIWVIAYVCICSLFFDKVKSLSDRYAKNQSLVTGMLVDSLSNAQNSKLFGRRVFEGTYLQRSLNKLAHAFRDKEWFMLKYYWGQTASITCMLAVMLYMLFYYYQRHQVTIGDFTLILGLTVFVSDNMWWVMEQIDQMNNSVGKCNQSLRAIFTPLEITDRQGSKPIHITAGKIVFNKVHFKHNEQEPLFQNKSVVIEPGQKVGLVGYSGGGKSTFVSLILRLFDISEGEILIDNQNIKDVTQDSLRSAIAMIPQDPALFHRTLKENIRYGKLDATDEEVIKAAKLAHAHEFIKHLAQGYDSLVGERGVKLSGGQRQRIAIARAILKNAPVLILDEATSQLDSVTESEIQESLAHLMRNKTTLVIAHRLSTLLNLDRILVFDNGKIVEDGTHKELLAKDGIYRELWDTQSGGFLPETKV